MDNSETEETLSTRHRTKPTDKNKKHNTDYKNEGNGVNPNTREG